MKFRKDDITREFAVRDGRVMTTIIVDGLQVSNPSLELFLAQGWEIVEEPEPTPEPEPYIPTRSEVIEQYIREHGFPTYGAELACINNYAMNPEESAQAYQYYMSVRAAAKEYADTIETRGEDEV